MNRGCVEFVVRSLTAPDVRGRSVLEVGSRNVNGSLRWHVERLGPASYVGVDITDGPGVDQVCGVESLIGRFGPDRFDLVFSTEMLEHVRDWRAALVNLKTVTKAGGILLFTTRSRGFGFHGYPFDFWRYELSDVEALFGDFETLALESDPSEPGVFFKGRKPAGWRHRSHDDHELYSIILGRKALDVRDRDIALFRAVYRLRVVAARVLPRGVRRALKTLGRALPSRRESH
jgi:SAM-dependent methyltransferase